jgi:cytidylate kinase
MTLRLGTPYVVAIDGPAGAGKSTIAAGVADRLGLTRVDTGAIYRVVTLVALERGITTERETAELLAELDMRFEGTRVLIGEREVTKAIRTPEVTREVSRIAAYGAVRSGLLELQRRLGRSHPRGAVLEGRDIGTVVFPDAEVKIFLTATPEERARRRTRELDEKGTPQAYADVLEEIRIRDAKDAGREVAPFRKADDAIEVDSTGKTAGEVCEAIVRIVRSRVRG